MDEMEQGLMPGIELAGVFSNRRACGAIERAKEAGIPTFTFGAKGKTREEFDAELLAALKPLDVDLIVLVGYMRILSSDFVNAYAGKIINVHPSLLPAFSGGMNEDVHADVIAAGVKETGATIHLVDESVDGGKILLQESVEVAEDETPESLKNKVQALEKKMMPEVIRGFANGKY
jgi:formyltetrahydrofolate-dependent phosphoribosylglycinamide formyltransferase